MRARTLLAGSGVLLLIAFGAMSCSESPGGGGGGGNHDASAVDTGGGTGGDGDTTDSTGTNDDTGVPPGTDASADSGVVADAGMANPTNPNNAMLDTDCDGLSDAEEFSTLYPNGQHTDPNNPDTDGDGIPDGVEVGRTQPIPGTNCPAFVGDADPSTHTSPVNADSDGDGIPDGLEDRDHNGRVDGDESNPLSTDSDGDGIPDAIEDANHNGVFDPGETNPLRRDTDGDGLDDGVEDSNHDGVHEPYETDPRSADTDCDGIADGAELAAGTSPLSADSDGDGLTDGVESGVIGAVPGTNCPGLAIDANPNSHTLVNDFDSDHDGIPDGVEDSNHNGAVDPGETDPNNPDSDGDGISDGDEVSAGYNPLDPNSPSPSTVGGLNAVCADANLKVVNFNVGGSSTWTLTTEQSTTYTAIAVSAAGVGVDVAALDDTGTPVAGFVLRMPLIGGVGSSAGAQTTAVNARIGTGAAAENLGVIARTSPRGITSHDGFDTQVSGVTDVSVSAGTRSAAEVRNALVRLITGLTAADFVGLPTTSPGANSNQFVYNFQVLVRTAPAEVLVVGTVLDRGRYDSAADNSSIIAADLTNGTALALADAGHGKDCDPFVAGTSAVADFMWMADISGSTDDDRGRIVSAANVVFNALQTNGIDFRMGVVPHTQSTISLGAANSGHMRGVGFTTDATLFATYLQDTSGNDGCEFGIDAASAALTRALPRSAPGVVDPLKFRDNAQMVVFYISDEYAQEITEGQCGWDPGGAGCSTGVSDLYSTGDENVCTLVPNAAQQACINTVLAPYISQIQANNGIAFAQVVAPLATPSICTSYACPQPGSQPENEPGLGYTDIVAATGGTYYSPCVDNPGTALQSIIDAVSGAASQFQLTGPPISSTIKVGITRIGMGGSGNTDLVPRDKDDGFDYDPVSNAIFFHGSTYRPNRNDLVVVSYRVWRAPSTGCSMPCPMGQMCDPQLGVCTCDMAACNACGPGQVCDASCQCACTADCNGQCGAGQVCNTQTCSCECAPDCGGACGPGTVCNPTTCACDCDSNCGGACAGTNLVCNSAACNCQCPADCGGTCASGTVCNTSLCACDCPADCSQHCPGMSTCDVANGCTCACQNNCGGMCPDNTICDMTTCQCMCPPDCTTSHGCINRQVCDPNNACGCVCPADCGGCASNETCEISTCRCVPRV